MDKSVQAVGSFSNIPRDIYMQLPESYQELNFKDVQDTLNYSEAELGGYFHKYFPRSYTETFTIMGQLLDFSENYRRILSEKDHLRLLDVGAGIGGNMTGLLKYISTNFPGIESVLIDSIDGNKTALDYQADIIRKINLNFTVRFNPVHHVFSSETLVEELHDLINASASYDIVMSSKFLNEFYRKDHSIRGVYSRFIEFGGAVLNREGILMITELTDPLPDHEYFNRVFNNETIHYYQTCSYPLKQVFPIQCHLWRDRCEDGNNCFVQQRYLCGKAKAFTQVFCKQSLGGQFYDKEYLDKNENAPILIKHTGCYGGYFCYKGKLRDTAQLS